MLDHGVVSPTISSWSFPLVVVAKPGTDPVEQRLCVDLRKLNDLIETDEFPIPNIDDLLNSVRGCKYYSCMDVCMAFWQVEMTEESKNLCAFERQMHIINLIECLLDYEMPLPSSPA